jgi:phenylpyruvate tautomerase PptA (4-oxalocrotonate tautomerase family)
MTIMRVGLAGPRLSPESKRELTRRLIDEFCAVEVGAPLDAARVGFMVRYEEMAVDDLWVGDRPMVEAGASGRAAVIQAQVMAGPWTAEMKGELFARLEAAVRDVAEMPKRGAGSDFWMTFIEVPEGGWGLGGRAVSIGDLAPVFTEDRQARIRAYLHPAVARVEE